MRSKEIDVIKLQQIFYRLPLEKTNNYEVHQNYVINFSLVQQRNKILNLTPQQLQKW